jgi:CRP/FNR family transcriptional activator FtrB
LNSSHRIGENGHAHAQRRCRTSPGLPLFNCGLPRTFDSLIAGGFLQKFPAGTTLLMEGDPVDFLYVLIEGLAELQGTWNDKETTLAVLRPISTFILAAVVLDADALMTARTIERSDILMISGEAVRRAMKEDAGLRRGRRRGAVGLLPRPRSHGEEPETARRVRTAGQLPAGRTGQPGRRPHPVTLPHEKRVLASLLGMTPENLSRAFANLADYGVLVNGPEVSIQRPVVLDRLAKPDRLIDSHLQPSPPGSAWRRGNAARATARQAP